MKKAILLIIIFLTGCTSLHVELPDGSSADYRRYMTKVDISELEITPNADGSVTVKIKGLTSDISEAMNTLNTAIEKMVP